MTTSTIPDDPDAAEQDEQRVPEMVGATSAPFSLGPEPTHISFAMHAPTGPAFSGANRVPSEVFLAIENITADSPLPVFGVYLNLLPDAKAEEHPELHAGDFAMFGLEKSGQLGQTVSLDVTNLFLRLPLLSGWTPHDLRVSFVPQLSSDAGFSATVGRVSLYVR